MVKNAPKARSSKTFYPNYYSNESKRAKYETRCYERLEFQFIKKKKQKHKIGAKENRIQLLSSAPCVCVLLLFIFIVKPELRTQKQQK